MLSLRNIKMPINHSKEDLEKKILKVLKAKKENIIKWEIAKKAVDSRKKDNVFYVYNINLFIKNEKKYLKIKNIFQAEEYTYQNIPLVKEYKNKPIIIGAGPAGLLAAITLLESGVKPIIIEQGKDVDRRQKDIDNFFENGILNKKSNVQFGAGGAGTFSDGKLTTGVNDSRKAKLVEELIIAGAPEEIKYLSKPHLGTDILSEVVKKMCTKIEKLGGKILYDTTFVDFLINDNNELKEIVVENEEQQRQKIPCEYLILAIGHSARETFNNLYENNIKMEPKPFAVGVRVEHPREEVDHCQYGNFADELDAASYKLNVRLDKRTLHTFCMCPGGVVVGAASEEGRVVTNGMSYYARDLQNSNSALLVNVLPEDYDGNSNPLNGIEFQRKLEEKAFEVGGENYYAPGQKVGDFLKDKKSESFDKVKPTYLPGVKPGKIDEVFPRFITDTLREGIQELQNKVPFLKDEEAVLTAVESRSSSPVKILRDDYYMTNIFGIIPCGEGAGYAGGIVSAAIDGIRCAEKVIENINSK